MGILQDRGAAQQWYESVSWLYDPVVSSLFWPPALQRRLLDRFDLEASDRVLDVGCGTGVTSGHLAQTGADVHAVDHSRPQLTRANAAVDGHVLRGDAHNIPYEDETFDAVVSVGAIMYFPDPEAALAEARRVTRPGGRVLVAGFNHEPHSAWHPAGAWAHLTNELLFYTYDDQEARDLFERAGWQDIDSEVTGPGWHPRLVVVTTARNPERGSRRLSRRPTVPDTR